MDVNPIDGKVSDPNTEYTLRRHTNDAIRHQQLKTIEIEDGWNQVENITGIVPEITFEDR
jgi:hypothetical protein